LVTALVTIFTIVTTIILCFFLIVILLTFTNFLLRTILHSPIIDNLNQIIEKKEEGVASLIFFWTIMLLFYLTSTFSYVRLFLTDFGLTGNQTNKLFILISQSYSSTNKQKFKVFSIILYSFIFVCPIWILSFFLIIIVSIFLLWGIVKSALIEINNINSSYLVLSFFIGWIMWTNLLTMPFWQSVKAVTYYQVHKRDDYDLMSNR